MCKALAPVLVGLLLAAVAAADTVYLRDGRQLVGVVSKAGGKVVLKMAYGTIEVDESQVIYIAYGTSTLPATAPDLPEPGPRAPVKVQPDVRWDMTKACLPDPIVFMLARQLELVGGQGSTEGMDLQLKQWRIAAHEGRRKARGQWITRDDRRRRVALFEEKAKEAADLARQARSIYGSTPADLAKKKQLEDKAAQALGEAAGFWPDDVMFEFLSGLLDLRAGLDTKAGSRFSRCLEAEPLVGAFHQGRGLALLKNKQAVEALEEFCICLELRDDVYEPMRLVEEAMKEVPGAKVKDPSYQRASDLLARYDKPTYTSTYGGTPWLLPGKRPWQVRDDNLSRPDFERVICRQGLGIPVAEEGILIVDAATVAGADQIYLQVAPDRIVPAGLVRVATAYTTSRKVDLPLAVIRAVGVTFQPVDLEHPQATQPDQTLTIRAANAYRQMGTEIRLGQAQVRQVGPDGPVLEGGVLPGETVAAAFADGKFVCLLTGRTDVQADDCGKSAPIPQADLTAWIVQAKRSFRYGGLVRSYSGPKLKDDVEKQAVSGQVFNVYAVAGEEFPKVVGP